MIPVIQWELRANACNRRQVRENARDQFAIGFGLASDGLVSDANFFLNQSQSAMKVKLSNYGLLSTFI